MFKKLKYIKYYTKVLLDNWTVNKNSYAQHGEDNLVEQLLPNGVLHSLISVQMMAFFSPIHTSLLKMEHMDFALNRPQVHIKKLKLNHLFHPKVKCIQSAVSNDNGHIFLIEDGYESTLSYVSKSKKNNSYSVRCQTIDKILEKNPRYVKVDLLTVDVEGHEKEVFESLTNKYFRAKIIIIESNKSQTNDLINLHSLTKYKAHFFNGVNTILTHRDEILNEIKIPKDFSKY